MSESDNDSWQSADWLSDELFSYCQSETLSEDGLREIIEHNNDQHDVSDDYSFFRMACCNEECTEEIIRCLLEYFPDAISDADNNGKLPLHAACLNNYVTIGIIQLLIDAAPDSVRHQDNAGLMALHHLCSNRELDEMTASPILKLLLVKNPESIYHANNDGLIPIHIACMVSQSTEFCRGLIEAFPYSVRMPTNVGMLPIHTACVNNTVTTVEYLYKLYPDAIDHVTTGGMYPIQLAICGLSQRADPGAAVDIVKFLLVCDPRVKFQKIQGIVSLLGWAYFLDSNDHYDDKIIGTALEVIEVIFDAHPEAIENGLIASTILDRHQLVQEFIINQLVYSHQSRDHRLMTTPDDNGQLPLHKKLQNNARLGSVKLLVKGNLHAVQSPDNSGSLPLHVACAHHDSASVVQYLIGLDVSTLDAVDREGNTSLHLACHCARHEIIGLLLDKYDAVSVSKHNAQKKLPIDLLFESNIVEDKESNEYIASVFQLLKAYPETIMVMNIDMQQQQSASAAPPSQNGKKRKFGNEE